MYAHDTVLYVHGTSVNTVQNTLQNCLDYVYNWCITNRLYMNTKKMKTMWFVNNNQDKVENTNFSISINGVLLSRVHNYLYLGVDLDHALSYDKQLDSVVTKTTQKVYIFRKIRRFISESTAIIVYKQMNLPLLEYCNILFNSGKKTKLEKLDKIQTKYIRIIENSYNVADRENESVLRSRYNLDSLQNRRDIQLACTMYRLSKRDLYVDHSILRENLTIYRCDQN